MRICFLILWVVLTVGFFATTMVVVAEEWKEGVQEVFNLLNEGKFISSAIIFTDEIVAIIGCAQEEVRRPEPEIRQGLMRAVSLRSRAEIQLALQGKTNWFFESKEVEDYLLRILRRELRVMIEKNWPGIDINAGQLPPGIQTQIYQWEEGETVLSVSLLFLWADVDEDEPEEPRGPSGQVSCPDDL